MAKYLKKRLSNMGFWVSLASLIPLSLQAFGDVSILPDNYQEIVTCFLSLLVALGVVSNPTTEKSWYSDDKKE